MNTNEIKEHIMETVAKILSFIGVTADVEVVPDQVEAETLNVDLAGEDLGVVIGYHGEGLTSLQTVLGLMVSKKFGRWAPLVVDINGYRREREEKIREMSVNAVDKVKFLLKPVELPPMAAYERRLVHIEVSKHPDVVSESVGEGFNRRVVVKPKESL